MKKLLIAFLLLAPWSSNIHRDYIKEERVRQQFCILEALIHEAGGESAEGIAAVLSVIQNRVFSGKYGRTFCDVIREYKQFSYRNHLSKEDDIQIEEPSSLRSKEKYFYIQHLAELASKGRFKSILPKDVLWYHTKKVNPKWNKNMQKVKVIGNHIFWKLDKTKLKKKSKK